MGVLEKWGRPSLQQQILLELVSFGSEEENETNVEVYGKEIEVHGHFGRKSILSTLFDGHPNLIMVDCTVPAVVNGMENKLFF